MADILDEILAATENVRSQLSKPVLLSYESEVSPRGVDEFPFALLHNHPPYFEKSNSPTSSQLVQSQPVLYDPSPFEQPKWAVTQPPHTTCSPAPTPPSAPTPPVVSLSTATTSQSLQTSSPTIQQPPSQQSRKRPLDTPPTPTHHHHHHHHQQQQQQQQQHKKVKQEACAVMPPSAKSILERREKAIREGRRKDAKLTEAERRILRRLRNRESAERCRLRRVQQAVQLEKKIESMQIENDRLVAMAEEYEKTIQRLEQVIANFSKQGAPA